MAPSAFIFPFCKSQHLGQFNVMEVSDGLKQSNRYILLAMLD
jgi:hypothetical protein